jgi:hypothetical protein
MRLCYSSSRSLQAWPTSHERHTASDPVFPVFPVEIRLFFP